MSLFDLGAPASRAQFLSRGAKGGLALAVGGTVLAATTGAASAAPRATAAPRTSRARSADVDIAKLAATAELLAIDFYTQAIKSKTFKGDDLGYLLVAREAERAHYDALAKVIGAGAPKGVKFAYPAKSFATKKGIATLGVALETAFVGAYLGAVTALESNDLKGVAASIAASESQHLSVFSDIAKNQPIGGAFPAALTADQALAAVKPFIAA